jgi:hypothetical protein
MLALCLAVLENVKMIYSGRERELYTNCKYISSKDYVWRSAVHNRSLMIVVQCNVAGLVSWPAHVTKYLVCVTNYLFVVSFTIPYFVFKVIHMVTDS